MKKNKQFMLMSFWGIVLVVDCHAHNALNIFGHLFPYNSFFIPMFVFISGYFTDCNTNARTQYTLKSFLTGVKHDFFHLMIPYYAYNLIYGIVVTFLNSHSYDFNVEKISLYSVFIAPFFSGVQFVFNGPGWFCPILFWVKVLYKFLFFLKIRAKIYNGLLIDSLFLILLVAIGLCCIVDCIATGRPFGVGSSSPDIVLAFEKIFFLMPFYQLGLMFRLYFENRFERIPIILRLSITCFGSAILLIAFANSIEFGSLYSMGGFKNAYTPYISSVLGISFWYTICELLLPSLKESRIINYVSERTSAIMYNHVFGFFLLNMIIVQGSRWVHILNIDASFIMDTHWNAYRIYSGIQGFGIWYVVFGIIMSCMIDDGIKYVVGIVKKLLAKIVCEK